MFAKPMDERESRIESIRRAVAIGGEAKAQWRAAGPQEIDGGIAFKIGYTDTVENFELEQGDFRPKQEEFTKVTDVFLDYATGIMLIRKDKTAPSAFLASRWFKEWLQRANTERGTSFDTIVQSIPMIEDFLAELRRASIISRLTFVVHGPNPADEGDIVDSLARFTADNGIQSTTVQLNAETIDQGIAVEIATAVGNLGNPVSATIQEPSNPVPRTIRTKKGARSVEGPDHPTPKQGRNLLDRIKERLKGNEKVGNGDGDAGST